MKRYDFNLNSLFFAEILTFSLPFIGLVGVVRFPELKAQIDELITRYNVMRRGLILPSVTIRNIVIPDNLVVIGKVVTPTMINSQQFASEVQEGRPISTISWVDVDLVSGEPGIRVETPFPLESTLAPIAQVTIGAAYERVKDGIEAQCGADPHSWPTELKYFRHCRNAAFHGNRFEVRSYGGLPGINPFAPPSWRSSAMPDDTTMNANSLIGDWLSLGDVPILLGDVTEVLESNGIYP